MRYTFVFIRFEQRIYNCFTSKMENNTNQINNYRDSLIENDILDMKKVLVKFQQFI